MQVHWLPTRFKNVTFVHPSTLSCSLSEVVVKQAHPDFFLGVGSRL